MSCMRLQPPYAGASRKRDIAGRAGHVPAPCSSALRFLRSTTSAQCSERLLPRSHMWIRGQVGTGTVRRVTKKCARLRCSCVLLLLVCSCDFSASVAEATTLYSWTQRTTLDEKLMGDLRSMSGATLNLRDVWSKCASCTGEPSNIWNVVVYSLVFGAGDMEVFKSSGSLLKAP